jgi:hypothetical protein
MNQQVPPSPVQRHTNNVANVATTDAKSESTAASTIHALESLGVSVPPALVSMMSEQWNFAGMTPIERFSDDARKLGDDMINMKKSAKKSVSCKATTGGSEGGPQASV